MANPVQTYVSTYVAAGSAAQSLYFTATFIMTAGFEAWVPVQITSPGTTSISAGAEVTVYRSTDNGVTWENVGSLAAVFPAPTAANQVQQKAVQFDPGYYLISTCTGGGSAGVVWSCKYGTAWEITAYV